jgi:uncharacterized protein (DUF433 family)
MARTTDIYGGRSPRELPFYSLADAARIVRIHPATLRTWVLGRPYPTRRGSKNWPALIRAVDATTGHVSFANLVELHVLSALRGSRVRVDRIRSATAFIRREMKTEHPLADVDTQTDCVDIYVEYLGRLVNVSSPQEVLRPLVERHLERIGRDEDGLASRLYPITRETGGPKVILIDPTRRFGRPVLASANVETSAIAERFMAGEVADDLAVDFGIEEREVEEAVRFESLLRAA